ncbi:hypothetical protein [Deinococcus sp. YIM 77859]|uniref:hypothetical protein n=1 Tax=Deinococcus sp. YIM 77859 TaxID=1540221 RepID=UPI000556FB78|nr:hypothetical protein [Deinococcus sp. YIM 77859]
MKAQQVARGLGWFSLGIGVLEVAAPSRLTRFLGVQEKDTLVRAYGVRELLTGLGLLTQPGAAAGWVWARVVGDVLDLGTLGRARPKGADGRKRTANTLAMLTAITVVDVLCARALALAEPPTLAGRRFGKGRH